MNPDELRLVLEALKGAYEELTTLENDKEWYCTSGHLMDQIEDAIILLEDYLG